jgi:hypothetical protein
MRVNVVLCIIFLLAVHFMGAADAAEKKISTSDRIAQMVEGRVTGTRKKQTRMSKKLEESDERKENQKLVPRAKNKVTKTIDSYAEQKAKAKKTRANHQSNKQGLRRIG